MTRENAEASDWRRWAAWYVFITETIDNYCFFVEYGNWRQHSVGGFPPVSTELETHARRHWGFWPIRRWAASQSMAMTWCCTRTSFPRTRSVQSRCWKYYQDLQKIATLLWEGRWVKVSLADGHQARASSSVVEPGMKQEKTINDILTQNNIVANNTGRKDTRPFVK